MARTRITRSRGGGGGAGGVGASRSETGGGNADEGSVERTRRNRKRETSSRKTEEGGLAEGEGVPPEPKRKRPDPSGDLPGAEKFQEGEDALRGLLADAFDDAPGSRSSVQRKGGEGDGGEEDDREACEAASQIQWGRLISQNQQHPHVALAGNRFPIGRSRSSKLPLNDRGVGSQLCVIKVEDGGPATRLVSMTCHSAPNTLSVNGKFLKKDERVVLRGGDEINIMGSNPHSYIFQPLDVTPPTALTPIAVPEQRPAQRPNPDAVLDVLLQSRMEGNAEGGGEGEGTDVRMQGDSKEPEVAGGSASGGNKEPEQDAEHTEVSQTRTGESKDGKGARKEAESGTKKRRDDDTEGRRQEVWSSCIALPANEEVSGIGRRSRTGHWIRGGGLRRSSLWGRDKSQIAAIREEALAAVTAFDLPEDSRPARHLDQLKEELQQTIISPEDIDVTLDEFPYYLGDGLKERLLQTAFVHFKCQRFTSFVSDLPSMSPKILIAGPPGSNRCQEAVVKALAKEVGACVLPFDKVQFGLEGISTEDAGEDLGGGGLDDYDDFDFLDDLEGKGFSSSAAEKLAVRHLGGLNASSSVPPRKVRRMGNTNFPLGNPPGHSSKDKSKSKHAPKIFKKGDRVMYVGNGGSPGPPGLRGSLGPSGQLVNFPPFQGYVCSGVNVKGRGGDQTVKGPWAGCSGKVVLTFENPRKVGVRFDCMVPGGMDLGGGCEDGHGFFCNSADMRLESTGRVQEQEAGVIDALFDVAIEQSGKMPVIILLKDVDKCVAGLFDRYVHFKRRIEALAGPIMVFGLYTNDSRRERPQGAFLSRLGPHPSALLELGFLDNLNRWEEKGVQRSESTKVMKMLNRLLPNRLTMNAPQSDPALSKWKKLIEGDMSVMREEANRQMLSAILARCGVQCTDIDTVIIQDTALRHEHAERLVGLAIASNLKRSEEPTMTEGQLVIKSEDFEEASKVYRSLQAEVLPTRLSLKDVATDNEYEKRLLGEVVPPEDVGVGFSDIGALENVKRTLQEVVMLPLQRPELFARGQLLKPTKGVLLFGPPGTGKTMLAKAVAAESGANFINVSVATVASKWFGEGEKYVRALFSLAHKIAPSVIFIDEVDSLLGRRDKNGEHEAMRKIKNEFMSSWDGLKTKESDRVLVLAATNRPMDLDEAVIRRMPRRLLVDLPNAENREKILSIILREEEIDEGLDFGELARMAEGYSGSDLKNLCLAAAFLPVRDFLEAEKKLHMEEGKPNGKEEVAEAPQGGSYEEADGMDVDVQGPKKVLSLKPSVPVNTKSDRRETGGGKSVKLRPITMKDMKKAMENVGASVATEAMNMSDLRQWNEMYGEGGNRRSASLSYFL